MWQCCQQYNCHLQCLTFARSEEWCSKNTIFLSQKYRECWKCLWLWTFIIAYPISRFISARGPPSMWRVTLFYLIAFCQVVMEEKLFHQNCLIKCRAVLVDPVCISVCQCDMIFFLSCFVQSQARCRPGPKLELPDATLVLYSAMVYLSTTWSLLSFP